MIQLLLRSGKGGNDIEISANVIEKETLLPKDSKPYKSRSYKPMFKYPLCEYYNCLEINNYTDDVGLH